MEVVGYAIVEEEAVGVLGLGLGTAVGGIGGVGPAGMVEGAVEGDDGVFWVLDFGF